MSSKIKKESSKINRLFVIYVVLLMLINIMPLFKYKISYLPSVILSFLPLVIVIGYSVERRYLARIIVCSFGLSLMYFLVRYQFDMISFINEFIRGIRFFVPACIFYYILLKNDKKAAKIIFAALAIVFSYVIFKTLMELQVNPIVARLLASGSNDDDLLALRYNNIGGFGFSYAVGALFPFLTDLVYSKKSKFTRFIAVCAIVLCSVFVISAQYTFLFILSFISIFIVIAMKSKNIFIKLSLIFGSVILMFGLGDFFKWLSIVIGQETLAEKFSRIASFFSKESDISILHSRPQIYMKAIKDFFYSPIWGNIQVSGQNEFYIDNTHSTVLAIMRGTGIMGLVFYLGGIFSTYYLISKGLKERNKNITSLKVGFAYYFLLSILNPTHFVYEISYALLLFVPLGIYLFGNTKSKVKGVKDDDEYMEE